MKASCAYCRAFVDINDAPCEDEESTCIVRVASDIRSHDRIMILALIGGMVSSYDPDQYGVCDAQSALRDVIDAIRCRT